MGQGPMPHVRFIQHSHLLNLRLLTRVQLRQTFTNPRNQLDPSPSYLEFLSEGHGPIFAAGSELEVGRKELPLLSVRGGVGGVCLYHFDEHDVTA
jgi:hypothetical protein